MAFRLPVVLDEPAPGIAAREHAVGADLALPFGGGSPDEALLAESAEARPLGWSGSEDLR